MQQLTAKNRAGGHFQYIRLVMRLRLPLAVVTMAIAGIGLIANLANVDMLMRPLGERSATHPVAPEVSFKRTTR